jgi:ABC-2 type transport system ATP-binding protein
MWADARAASSRATSTSRDGIRGSIAASAERGLRTRGTLGDGSPVQPQTLIEVEAASQRFGSRVALDQFSISIEEGTVVGILGPNGAGKTTLINLVAGLRRPVSGAVRWRGDAVTAPFPTDVRRQIGMMTQETALYDELTVRQNLRFAADLFGVQRRDGRIDDVLELVGLSERIKDRAGSLSGGLQRRLALGRALLHDPEFLILDEPTLGVDVEARHALWGHVRWLRRSGKTVLLSTNHLDEAQALCDWIVVLREGRHVTEGDPAELLARTGRLVEIECLAGSVEIVRERVAQLHGIGRIDVHEVGLTVHVPHGESPDAVTVAALDTDVVQSVRVRPPDMLEVFQSLTDAGDD